MEIGAAWGYCNRANQKREIPSLCRYISNILALAQKCNIKAGFIGMSLAQYPDEAYLESYPADKFMNDYDIVINLNRNAS